MQILHVGLACRSEVESDRFYQDLLGLSKQDPKTLSRDLANAIFGVDRQLIMINYVGDDVRFEIFITDTAGDHAGDTAGGTAGGTPGDTPRVPSGPIAHTCLAVDDLEEFLTRCRALDVEVARIPRGNYTVTFIKDYAGNLFEVKDR